jgi:hypothetical protein
VDRVRGRRVVEVLGDDRLAGGAAPARDRDGGARGRRRHGVGGAVQDQLHHRADEQAVHRHPAPLGDPDQALELLGIEPDQVAAHEVATDPAERSGQRGRDAPDRAGQPALRRQRDVEQHLLDAGQLGAARLALLAAHGAVIAAALDGRRRRAGG